MCKVVSVPFHLSACFTLCGVQARSHHHATPLHSMRQIKPTASPNTNKKKMCVQRYCIPDGEVSPQATSISHPNTHSAPC